MTRCTSSGDLYPLSATSSSPPSTFAVLPSSTWHNRLGHPGNAVLDFLRVQKCIQCNKDSPSPLCHGCQLGKHCRLPFSSSNNTTFAPFSIIHTDLWTSPIISPSGYRYYLLCLDDYSHYLWVFPLKSKSQVFSTFLLFLAHIKNQFHSTIKTIQCDNGTEYVKTVFKSYCDQHGIVFRHSCPYTSSQNGKAERMIRSTNDVARSLLFHASLPPSFWVEALHMATYLLNIRPTKTLDFLTPVHRLYNRAPSYTHLRTFGCLCYPNISATMPHKLSPRSTPCLFLGYPPHHRGYRCLDLSSKKIIISRHVTFDESSFPFSSIHSPLSTDYDFLRPPTTPSPAPPSRATLTPLLPSSPSPSPTDEPTPPFPPTPSFPPPAQPTHHTPPQPPSPRGDHGPGRAAAKKICPLAGPGRA